MPVVIKPRLPVMVLPRQPNRLVHAAWIELLLHIPPRIEPCCPHHLVLLVRQRNRRPQMIAVVELNRDGRLTGLLLFY